MDGKAHKAANIMAGTFLTVTTYIAFGREDLTIAAAVGSTMGTVITPDYDLNNNLPRSFITRLPFIAVLWAALWRPYQLSVKHRSWISHSPVISTVIRILYLSFWIWLIFYILTSLGLFFFDPWIVVDWMLGNYEFTMMVFFAWVFQDIIHLWLDFMI